MKEFNLSNKTHYVFESTNEAIDLLSQDAWSYLNINNQSLEWTKDLDGKPKSPFRHWAAGLCSYDNYISPRIGDWVISDDGFIIQVLDTWIRPQTIKKKKEREIYRYNETGEVRFAVIIKTVTGTYNCINNKFSWIKQKMIVSHLTLLESAKPRCSIATETREMGKHLTLRKKLFAYYCCVYLNPVKAYWEVNNFRAAYTLHSNGVYNKKVVIRALELLKDEYVVKEIKTYMNIEDFKNKLKEAINGNGMGVERAVKSMKIGLEANEDNPKKTGGLGHLGFIKMQLDINKFVDDIDAKNLDTITEEKGSISKTSSSGVILPSSHAENMALPMPNSEIIGRVKVGLLDEVKIYNENLENNKKIIKDNAKEAEFKDVI